MLEGQFSYPIDDTSGAIMRFTFARSRLTVNLERCEMYWGTGNRAGAIRIPLDSRSFSISSYENLEKTEAEIVGYLSETGGFHVLDAERCAASVILQIRDYMESNTQK